MLKGKFALLKRVARLCTFVNHTDETHLGALHIGQTRVNGYRVKAQYQPVAETEKITRRDAVGQVILQALRRMKEERKDPFTFRYLYYIILEEMVIANNL